MNRTELINKIIVARSFKTYLEIGCQTNANFNKINCLKKIGVDPESGGTHRMTSDEFFKTNDETFDIIFIDGLHEAKQVFKDIYNSLFTLSDSGVIVVHDCNPQDEDSQKVPRIQTHWNGDVWKAFISFRCYPDIEIFTGDFDEGCGVILKHTQNTDQLHLDKLYQELTWDDLVTNREKYLRLVSSDEIMKKINESKKYEGI